MVHGMLLRRFTDFILQGRFQAIGLAFALAFVPIIMGISVLIAVLVTLRKGIYEGAWVMLAATIPSWIGVFAMPSSESAAGIMAFASVALITTSNFSTWVFAGLLRRYGNWSFLLELSIVLAILAVWIAHLLYPDIQNWWVTQLNAYLSKTVSSMSGLQDEAVALNDMQMQLVSHVKEYATGFAVVSVLFNALLQVVLGRWWQAIIFNPGGLRLELRQIRLNHIAGVLFVVGFVLAFIGNKTVLDMMPVFFAIFAIAGLSLAHSLASLTKLAWLWLVIIYVGIVLAFQPSVAVLAVMAFLDTWLDFRKRFRVI
jgi:hypothetical protein